MSLQVHEHDAFHHLFDVSVTFLNLILWFFNVNVCHVFYCLYLWVFGGSFDAVINGITL